MRSVIQFLTLLLLVMVSCTATGPEFLALGVRSAETVVARYLEANVEATLPTALAVAVEPPPPPADPRAPLPGYAEATTVMDICEYVGEDRPAPTDEERRVTIELIRKTCSAMGTDQRSCDFVELVIARRESKYEPATRSQMAGDRRAATKSYIAAASKYGWQAEWTNKKRGEVQLTAIEGREQNPYYADTERWISGGLGLGGINIAYSLHRFDPLAPPEVLCDPVINTIVQIQILRIAMSSYKASNFYEAQAIYGGRSYSASREGGERRPLSCSHSECSLDMSDSQQKRAERYDDMLHARCVEQGIDCMARPNFGRAHRRDSPEQLRELADTIRGGTIPPWDAP